uniref:Uncharacterized protein n=1 Tax=Triticum urartu TaxID=4572 RepID=A0A8R7PGH9_TRIUA
MSKLKTCDCGYMDSLPPPKLILELFGFMRKADCSECSIPCSVATCLDLGPVSEVVLIDLDVAILGVLTSYPGLKFDEFLYSLVVPARISIPLHLQLVHLLFRRRNQVGVLELQCLEERRGTIGMDPTGKDRSHLLPRQPRHFFCLDLI